MEGAYPARNPATAARVVDGEAVIIQPDKGVVNVLNGVGSFIWELSDGTRAMEDIARAVAAEYAVSLEQARADAQEFVTSMVQEGMLLDLEAASGQAEADS